MSVSDDYVDIDSLCRICLAERGNINIFGGQEKDVMFQGCSIAERIMSFAYVKVAENDGLPSKICLGCLAQIDQAFELKAQCEYADATLRQLCSEANICLSSSNNLSVHEVQLDNNAISLMPDRAIIQTPFETPSIYDSEEGKATTQFIIDKCSDNQIDVSADKHKTVAAPKENINGTATLSIRGNAKMEMVNCTENVRNGSNLALSQLNQIKKSSSAVCSECGKQFNNQRLLEAHEVLHSGYRPFICSSCGKSFLRLSNLREHEKRHLGHKNYLCSNCGKLAIERKDHHCLNFKKSFVCDICDKRFVTQGSLTTHKKRHEKHSKYSCSECKNPFYSRQELERHMRVHYGIRPYACHIDNCSISFYSKGELNRHTRYHTGEKKFSCDLCDKTFFESGHLASHQKKHSGEQTYRCSKCPKAFFDSSKLKRHMGSHMKTSKKKAS